MKTYYCWEPKVAKIDPEKPSRDSRDRQNRHVHQEVSKNRRPLDCILIRLSHG